MILSRIIARRRIAAGMRPGWFAAWGLVAADAVLLFAVLFVVFNRVSGLLDEEGTSDILTIVLLFVAIFVPMQVVLILSSMWAARSRWRDDGEGNKKR